MFKKFFTMLKERNQFEQSISEKFTDKKLNGKVTALSVIMNVVIFVSLFLLLLPAFKQYVYVDHVFITLVVLVGILLYFIFAFGSYFNFKLLVFAYNLDVDYKKTRPVFFFDLFAFVMCIILILVGIFFKIFL